MEQNSTQRGKQNKEFKGHIHTSWSLVLYQVDNIIQYENNYIFKRIVLG